MKLEDDEKMILIGNIGCGIVVELACYKAGTHI